MRLTDEQIKDTVAHMKLSDELKAVLLRNIFELHQPEARFVVFAAWKNGKRVPDCPTCHTGMLIQFGEQQICGTCQTTKSN